MIKRQFLAALLMLFSTFVFHNSNNADTIDFDEFQLDPDSFFDGYGSDASTGQWSSQGVQFNTNRFGPGWSYSNVDDTDTAGFTNQWAAFTGADVSGNGNYALANSFQADGAYFNLPGRSLLQSVFVTNSTYAAISMRDGDAFGKQFGGVSGDDPDFFLVRFTGYTEANAMGSPTGSVDLFLADFRFTDNQQDFILETWQLLDLSGLGEVQSVAISFDGSDVGGSGLNTPTYVAIDELTFVSVPEPGTVVFLGGCMILVLRRKSSRGF